jgi:hypothetical protein
MAHTINALLDEMHKSQPTTTVVFLPGDSDFASIFAAHKYCKENDISYGQMQRSKPIGLVWGDAYIAKFDNIPSSERHRLDGWITFSDDGPRHGTATLTIKRKCDD